MDSTAVHITSLLLLASLSCTVLAVDVSMKCIATESSSSASICPSQMWPDLIRKARQGGLDTIETYVFWNAHEPRRREYTFEGNLDIVRFIKEIQYAGMYAILRIGPYACAEWNYGGFPVWLHQIPGIKLRTDNQLYKDEMQNFTTYMVNLMKQEELFAPQGGPIILAQIENEYGNVMAPYGEAGKAYIRWCAEMAVAQNVGVPWVMCKQADAPQPMINTCNGFYCHNFHPNNPNSPKIWTENWTGWFKSWDGSNPHRPAEDVAYAVARFYQTGGTLQNYYMYHGGTNFGRTAGGPYMATAYDYDAPLDEYGNLRQPKWGHLKELHSALRLMENALLYGTATTINAGNGLMGTKYSANGTSAYFLLNTNQGDVNATFEGNLYYVPGMSVSLLPECKQEVYNTAKVTAPTTIMKTKSSLAEDLVWEWRAEDMQSTLEGEGSFTASNLQEQILVTGDTSDYLWYMTSVNSTSQGKMTLRVNTTGHILHAFINGVLVGSRYAPNGHFQFVFQQAVTLKAGPNIISLLSATVGLKNYGSFFDEAPTGIVGGPVQLIGSNNTILDLSKNEWTYQVGLQGIDKGLYLDTDFESLEDGWNREGVVINRPFTWYKTMFNAPLGTDAVVVDLLGMHKGEAWVNGQSIGRYWANYKATSGACGTCDYRTTYDGDHTPCRTGCGQPSQRFYHVPRSFLKPGKPNTLILFEEAGGNPSQVNMQTVVVSAVCTSMPEGKILNLSCQGGNAITDIEFASFGDPQGVCGQIQNGMIFNSTFKKGTCESSSALDIIKKACIGKDSCSIDVTEDVLGSTNCVNTGKKLAVVAIC